MKKQSLIDSISYLGYPSFLSGWSSVKNELLAPIIIINRSLRLPFSSQLTSLVLILVNSFIFLLKNSREREKTEEEEEEEEKREPSIFYYCSC